MLLFIVYLFKFILRKISDSWHNTGYVFTRPTGLPVVPQEVTKEFTRFVKEHNLPHLTFHGLRHAFATLGLIAGIPAKIESDPLPTDPLSLGNYPLWGVKVKNCLAYQSRSLGAAYLRWTTP